MSEKERKVADHDESVEDIDVITLEFDDGERGECEIMGVFDVDDENIAYTNDDTDDVYIYGYKEVGEDEFKD